MAVKVSSGKKRAELKRLSGDVRNGIYDMLRIADELTRYHAYVDQYGGEAQLIDDLERKEFAHFGGKPKLGTMLMAFRAHPERSTWEEYQFNVTAIIELSRPTKDNEASSRNNWKALAKEVAAERDQLRATLEDYKKMVAQLQARCDQLLSENGELRGRVNLLEEYAAA